MADAGTTDIGAGDPAGKYPVFVIDQEVCAGHGRCYTLAPDSFTADDSGYGVASGRAEDGRDSARLSRILASCPEQAISIEYRAD
jgi:ferredoxin